MAQAPGAIITDQGTRFNQGVDDLFQIKGVALHIFLDKSLQFVGDGLGLEKRFHHYLRF